ncbi:MAG: hypothetical protein WBD40_11290 [Tepidisphaeraceae bacterium]
MHRYLWCAILAFLTFAGIAVAAESTTAPATADATRRRVTFTDRSPVSSLEEYCRRTRQSAAAFKREGNDHEYALADESFEIFVPASCSADNPHGLLVRQAHRRQNEPISYATRAASDAAGGCEQSSCDVVIVRPIPVSGAGTDRASDEERRI